MKIKRMIGLILTTLMLVSLTQITFATWTITCNAPSAYCTFTESPAGKYLISVNLKPTGYTPYSKATFYFTFGSSTSGWQVNIGDSITNNGFGGDSGTQSNDAELQIQNGTLNVYKNDAGGSGSILNRSNCAPANNKIRIEITDNKVVYFNYATGDHFTVTDPHLFALNGQADSEGSVNYNIYASLNRVVSGDASRVGTGVVKAEVYLSNPLNTYWGELHNHSTYSDGLQAPQAAYDEAKAAGLDFFGLADHSDALTQTEWSQLGTIVDNINNANQDFVAFRGFEYSSNEYGHIAVVDTASYCTTSQQSTFSSFITWLNAQSGGVGFFNHPERQNSTYKEFGTLDDHFKLPVSSKMVGMELFNKEEGFSRYYYGKYDLSNGTTDSQEYFDRALLKGWKISPSGAGDNHQIYWGRNAQNQTTQNARRKFGFGVLAQEKTKSSIMQGLQNRRFFSTTNYKLQISVEIKPSGNALSATYPMGSTVSPGTYDVFINAKDTSGISNLSWYDINKNGTYVYGTNISGSELNLTLPSVYLGDGEFLYYKIRNSNGDEVISAPIYAD